MKKEIVDEIYKSQKNLIVAGDISTGKTTNVIFPLVNKMINSNENLLFLDSKEEYINKYYNDLNSKNYNIIILNFRDMNKSEGWNPLEYPYKLYKNNETDRALEYIEKIGKTIYFEGKALDPFLSIAASDFFTGTVLSLFEDAKEEEVNLNSINDMLLSSNEKYMATDYITKYFELKDNNSTSYTYVSTTVLAPKDTKGSILTLARQKIRNYVSREKLSVLMSKTTFEYDEILKKPTAIFIINKDENKNFNDIISMFIEQLFTFITEKEQKKNFNFILDNFDTLNNINDFKDMLSSGISRKIKFIISTRSQENLYEKYTDYLEKLSNLIKIKDKIEITLNDEKKIIDKRIKAINYKKSNVKYPKIEKKEIETFDLITYVKDKNKDKIANVTNDLNIKNINVLKERIDKKIAEFEEEIKSELQQFKINV